MKRQTIAQLTERIGNLESVARINAKDFTEQLGIAEDLTAKEVQLRDSAERETRSIRSRLVDSERMAEDARLMLELVLEEHHPIEILTDGPNKGTASDGGATARALRMILGRLPARPDAFARDTPCCSDLSHLGWNRVGGHR